MRTIFLLVSQLVGVANVRTELTPVCRFPSGSLRDGVPGRVLCSDTGKDGSVENSRLPLSLTLRWQWPGGDWSVEYEEDNEDAELVRHIEKIK